MAKALKEFAKTNKALVLKGGVLDGNAMSVDEVKALADLPSREVMYAEFAGALEHMLGDFAGLLDSKLREFVYAMQELEDKGGPGGAGSGEAPAEASADDAAPAEEATADEAE